jgi:hypothetical protein
MKPLTTMTTVRSMTAPASPWNFQAECRSTMYGPTIPVKMWNCSQDDIFPHLAMRLRLRRL